MTVDEIDAAVDQPVREADLIPADGIAPVGSPVDGDDRDITGLLGHRVRPMTSSAVASDRSGR